VKEDVSRKAKKRRFSQRREDRKENLSKKERKAAAAVHLYQFFFIFPGDLRAFGTPS
jgi:hypothetical protein